MKAMGITKPHEELMEKLAAKGGSDDYGQPLMLAEARRKVKLVEKTTNNGIRYKEYARAER